MSAAPRLDLALLWHMHQPEYRDLASGEFRMPWAYLHAIKDYADMAWHLEQHPGMRAVVNFTPVLLDQLADYADQFATGNLRDPLLRLLARSGERPLSEAERAFILRHCSGTGHERMVRPLAAYKELRDLPAALEARGAEAVRYLSDQFYDDLVTWHHLAWTGETVRRSSPLVTRLMSAGARFTPADRRGRSSCRRVPIATRSRRCSWGCAARAKPMPTCTFRFPRNIPAGASA
jgi:alpha-amylase/alpha-mannosidase (GH57 family)